MKQKISYSTPQSIGQRIAFLRERMDMTQQDFAEMMEISRGKLSQIEIGRNEPNLALLQKIVTKCSTSYEWLIDGKGDLPTEKITMAAEPEDRYVTKKELEEIIKKLKS